MSRYISYETSMATSYPELSRIIAPQYRSAPAEDIEVALAEAGIDAEDLENFLSDIGKGLSHVGKAVAGALPTILPVAGQVVGAIGGPVGSMVGGALGRFAGQAIGSALGPGGQPTPQPGQATPFHQPSMPHAIGAPPATAQLLQLLTQPATLRALLAMLLGPAGARNISVAGTPVSVGAFANALGALGAAAAEEYHVISAAPGEGTPRYLESFDGEVAGDIANPRWRAARLVELLQEAEPEEESAYTANAVPRSVSRWEAQRAADDLYDALEIAELYSEAWAE